MTLRPLIIDNVVRARIAEIKAHAQEHHVTLEQSKNIVAGKEPPIGSNEHNRVIIPIGYMVVYSLDEQEPGLCHHISISVVDQDSRAMPNPIAVNAILEAFGMPLISGCLLVWSEAVGNGVLAVNAVAFVEQPQKKGTNETV